MHYIVQYMLYRAIAIHIGAFFNLGFVCFKKCLSPWTNSDLRGERSSSKLSRPRTMATPTHHPPSNLPTTTNNNNSNSDSNNNSNNSPKDMCLSQTTEFQPKLNWDWCRCGSLFGMSSTAFHSLVTGRSVWYVRQMFQQNLVSQKI